MKASSLTKSRSIVSGMLALACTVALMLPATAFGITADEAKNQDPGYKAAENNVGNTEYWLQIIDHYEGGDDEPGGLDNMSIDVPIKVTLALKADGTFVTPTALKNVIENNSEFPVNVTNMALTEKNGFALKAATGFDGVTTNNIFSGKVASVSLKSGGTDVDTSKQAIAFTKLGSYAKNAAWGMASADNATKSGSDCLFIQLDGEIGNVSGKYFTSPINVFDITYTFEATSADLTTTYSDITD